MVWTAHFSNFRFVSADVSHHQSRVPIFPSDLPSWARPIVRTPPSATNSPEFQVPRYCWRRPSSDRRGVAAAGGSPEPKVPHAGVRQSRHRAQPAMRGIHFHHRHGGGPRGGMGIRSCRRPLDWRNDRPAGGHRRRVRAANLTLRAKGTAEAGFSIPLQQPRDPCETRHFRPRARSIALDRQRRSIFEISGLLAIKIRLPACSLRKMPARIFQMGVRWRRT